MVRRNESLSKKPQASLCFRDGPFAETELMDKLSGVGGLSMDEPQTKTRLLKRLNNERARWETLLAEFDEDQLVAPILPDEHSIKDVIAHLLAWQRRTVAHLEAALEGETPRPPDWPAELDSDEDVDQINGWIYQTYRPHSLDDVLQEWQQVFQQVLDLGEALSERALSEPGRYPWLEGAPLSEVLVSSYEHYHDEHLIPLREWLTKS
jgi:hypothetical protein